MIIAVQLTVTADLEEAGAGLEVQHTCSTLLTRLLAPAKLQILLQNQPTESSHPEDPVQSSEGYPGSRSSKPVAKQPQASGGCLLYKHPMPVTQVTFMITLFGTNRTTDQPD